MQVPGIGLVDAVPAVTLASIVADVLLAPLPQPDLVLMWPGSMASVSFQFSIHGSGPERFGYVQEWANHYGVQVDRTADSHATVFKFMGVEFKIHAPVKEAVK